MSVLDLQDRYIYIRNILEIYYKDLQDRYIYIRNILDISILEVYLQIYYNRVQILDRYRYRLDIEQIFKKIKIPIDRLDRNFEQLEEKIEGRDRSISLIGKLTFEL